MLSSKVSQHNAEELQSDACGDSSLLESMRSSGIMTSVGFMRWNRNWYKDVAKLGKDFQEVPFCWNQKYHENMAFFESVLQRAIRWDRNNHEDTVWLRCRKFQRVLVLGFQESEHIFYQLLGRSAMSVLKEFWPRSQSKRSWDWIIGTLLWRLYNDDKKTVASFCREKYSHETLAQEHWMQRQLWLTVRRIHWLLLTCWNT